MRTAWSILKYVIITIIALTVILAAAGATYVTWQKSRLRSELRITAPEGIQAVEQVKLGGLDQWIYIRSEDQSNPVMLFLHGGPGSPEAPPVTLHNTGLEEHFVVVNWDQRGAGKSYRRNIPAETMNLEQFIQDALELSEMLIDRFGVEKIYLVGHSWGTIVGTHAAERRPDLFHAYIGIGQAVDFIEAEKISYRFTLDRAKETGNTQAIAELEAIGPPPYNPEDFQESIGIQRKWLFKFGGEAYGKTNRPAYERQIITEVLFFPDYTLFDTYRFLAGNLSSFKLLLDDLLAVDFVNQVPGLEVPVYFIAGRYDYVTVSEMVELYYEILDAPQKELIWFEYSAHSPNFEEPELFIQTMAEILAQTHP